MAETPKIEEVLYSLQSGCCFYCGGRMARGTYKPGLRENGYTSDHVLPKAEGFSLMRNRVLACHRCNQRKDNRLPSIRALHKFELLLELLDNPRSRKPRVMRRFNGWRLPNF